MLGYTQEMLVTANEARIEARDAGTTTTRRRQLTSEFSYSPEVRLWEGGNPIVFLDDLRAYYGLCGSNSRRRDLRHYFLFADIHDKSVSRGQKLSRRASEKRVHKILRCFSSRSCLSAVVPL